MKVNTPEQIANGRRLLKAYGSWQCVRENSRYDHSRGVLVVARRPLPAAPDTASPASQPGTPEGDDTALEGANQ